jgi:quinol-cytochrome oxidoreductase complex cytochrome b subunit
MASVGRGEYREGPGAATATPIEVGSHEEGGHALEPEYKRLPIGPDHILYPVLVGLALFPILLGAAGQHLADDLPEDETHPFFPDHFWPYPIIAVIMLVTVGLLSAFVQKNLALEASADPRTVVIPRPDWYFLFLFQALKLANEFVINFLIVPGIVVGLLIWPFIDDILAFVVPKRLGWATWPIPGHNIITGTGWVLFIGLILFLTLWSVSGITLFGITGG